MKKPELLAPGGSLEKCKIAFLYGADAVYAGGRRFSLRSYAKNLDSHDLAEAVFFAHTMGKQFYVTVNIFARETDLAELPPYLEYLEQIGVDAIIASDPAVLCLAQQHARSIPIHWSTQANSTNSLAIEFWRRQGVRRINLARELSFQEIAGICAETDTELEMFVHGAMCVSYSGRCLLSAFLSGRPANRGSCTQPCRWSYDVIERNRPAERFGLSEDRRGTYIFNSKDLSLIEEIGKLLPLGMAAFKIEGRMKGALYLATVTRAYRQAIDRYWQCPDQFHTDPRWLRELDRVSHRPYSKGLLFPESTAADRSISETPSYLRSHDLAGLIRKHPNSHREYPAGMISQRHPSIGLEVRTRLEPNTLLEFLYPDGATRTHLLEEIIDLRGRPLEAANPNSTIELALPFSTFPNQVVRMRRPDQPRPTRRKSDCLESKSEVPFEAESLA